MKKKIAFFVSVALIAFIGHGCGQPVSIDLKVKTDNLKYSFNTDIGNVDIYPILKTILDGNDEIDASSIRLYDMVNYQGAQAFLGALEMELLESFDPSDYLDDINFQLGSEKIESSITLPPFTPEKINGKVCWFDMNDLFTKMQDIINSTSMPPVTEDIPLPYGSFPIGLPPGFASMPDIMVWPSNHSSGTNFDSAVISTGEIVLKIEIISAETIFPPGPADLTAASSISFTGIELLGKDSGDSIGIASGHSIVLNSLNHFSEELRFDIAGETISRNDLPYFAIGGLSYTQNDDPFSISVKLKISPRLEGIALRGAKGLKIGSMEPALPNEIRDAINLDNLPEEFLNAKIEKGHLLLQIALPPEQGRPTPETTYISGVTITYKIALSQGPVSFDFKTFNGLGTPCIVDFQGLPGNKASLANKYISGSTLSIDAGNTEIVITTDPINGADFALYDDDVYHYDSDNQLNSPPYQAYTHKVLPVKISMDMAIDELGIIRWKTTKQGGGDLISIPTVPPIDFGSIGGRDISKFITSITFDSTAGISANIDFTTPEGGDGLPPALQNRMAFKLDCPELGFSDLFQVLDTGSNVFSGVPPENPFPLRSGSTARVITPSLQFASNIYIDPNNESAGQAIVENAKYIELGPLVINNNPAVNNGETELSIYGTVSFEFNWEEANIDLKEILTSQNSATTGMLEGSFPALNSAALDLSMIRDYMGGFKFEDLDVSVLLGGPESLIELIKPKLTLSAAYERLKAGEDPSLGASWEAVTDDLFSEQIQSVNAGNLASILPPEVNGKYIYEGTGLPPVEGAISITKFADVISDFPRELRFVYEMDLPSEVTVNKSMFSFEGGNHNIKALLLIKLPLKLKAVEDNAGFTIPNDSFAMTDAGGNKIYNTNGTVKLKDLFGRESADGIRPDARPGSDEDPFKGIEIREAVVSIQFHSNFFRGARLHIDREKRLFGSQGLLLNNGSNTLTVAIKKSDWDNIKNYIIQPEIRITFPKDAVVAVPRNVVPARVSFSVKGDYLATIEF